ncbi:MAG: hypothetical protein IIX02_00655 [Clostridia bacterium]|nr:hypothetical protein [Clostridia bacterium]
MRKVGELKGKPIVEGNPNEVKNNQIHYKESEGNINLSERKNGSLEVISGSSGGGSSKVKYYNCIDENGRALVGELCAGGYIPYANVFTWDSNGNPLDTYIGSCKLLDSLGVPRFGVRHIAFQPISIITEGNRITFNTIEELFLLFGTY